MKSINKEEEFLKLLLGSLPAIVDAGNEKHNVHFEQNQNIKTRYALAKRTFISFNSEQRISLMIFDLDYIAGCNAVEILNLNEMVHFIYGVIGVLPTYVCRTTKGYQFGFHLYKHIYMHQQKAVEYLKAIKIAVTKALGCDVAGSHRLNGVWRNPLRHPHYYSGEIEYELKQFAHLLEKKKPVARVLSSSTQKVWGTIPISALKEGQRHEKLYLMAVTYAYYAEKLSLVELQTYLHNQNAFAQPPLTDKEVNSIASNVHKKKIDATLYIAKQHLKDVDLGVMLFEKMRNLTREEYEMETKRRQSLSAERTNEIRREKNKKEIVSKIIKAIETLKALNKDITILGIAKTTGLSRNTIKKYLSVINTETL